MIKKSTSLAWQTAKKIARRKHVMWVPVRLSEDGNTVTVQGLIRGNEWDYTLPDLIDRVTNRRLNDHKSL